MKISNNARERFAFFSRCQDSRRLNPPVFEAGGPSALEAFHAFESWGQRLPTSEPELLSRALNGKAQHGMTVQGLAEGYVDRLVFASELKEMPEWVQTDVLKSAAKIAYAKIGYVPTFVRTGEDFSTLEK